MLIHHQHLRETDIENFIQVYNNIMENGHMDELALLIASEAWLHSLNIFLSCVEIFFCVVRQFLDFV